MMAEHGQDVYAFENVLQRGGAGPGDTIAFFLHWSARGQPQASSPLVRLAAGTEGTYACKGTFKPGNDPAKGFGFIECQELKDLFGRDVYVAAQHAQGYEHGALVKFNAFVNREQKPNVQAMEPCTPDWEPVPGDLTQHQHLDIKGSKGGKGGKDGWGKGAWDGGKGDWGKGWGGDQWGKGGGWDKGGWGKGFDKGGKGKGGGGGGGPPTSTGKMAVGVIKSFNEMNNYGFIECEEVKNEYGADVFVHGRGLPQGLTVTTGQNVQFEVGVNAAGKPQAINVQVLDESGVPMAAASEEPPTKIQRTLVPPGTGLYSQQHQQAPPTAEAPDAAAQAETVMAWAQQALLAEA